MTEFKFKLVKLVIHNTSSDRKEVHKLLIDEDNLTDEINNILKLNQDQKLELLTVSDLILDSNIVNLGNLVNKRIIHESKNIISDDYHLIYEGQ